MRYQSSAVCLVLAVLAAVGLAGPAAAGKQVPFKGSIEAVETYDIQFPTRFVEASGSGNATHLGRFTVTYEHVANLPTRAGTGFAHFIAANGDSLFTEITSQGAPTETPGIIRVVERHTITGGTGRFVGATGRFTLDRLVSPATGVTSGSFEGTISTRGRGHDDDDDDDDHRDND